MTPLVKTLSLLALCCASGIAVAQQQAPPPGAPAPAKPTAQSEAGEPRADTSNPPATLPAPPAAAAGTPAAPAPPTGRAAPAARTPSPARTPPAARAPPAAASPKMDRLELGTATVTGSQEQPKVMYVVPWKRSDIGDLAGKPMNSLVDEILAPVDRDVFKREVVYYQAVQADASQNGAPPKPAQQGEK
jgi:hypothetical protein